jgi:hypothetical protein
VTPLGASFAAAVRKEFSSVFQHFRLVEVGEDSNLNFATVIPKNASHYVRIGCDFRDRTVYASIGRLAEGLVPPFPIAPSRTPEDVREIGDAVLAWLATGNRAAAFEAGLYPEETSEEIAAAVRRVAGLIDLYGRRLLGGDGEEWRRAAELTVTREWRSS